MEKLTLVLPSKEHEILIKEYIQEFLDNDSGINGTGSVEKYLNNYDEWLGLVDNYLTGIDIPEGSVPGSTYFAFRESDNKLVGTINIRHELNDFLLQHGGHIGYGVRPTERRKGYATQILALGLEKLKNLAIDRALITCDKSNIGSAKVIANNLGILENELTDGIATTQRYWIDVDEALTSKNLL